MHVLDGGSLIHRMVWHRNDSYKQIYMNYVQYIRTHYDNNLTVVFDGYPTDKACRNTNAEIYRRTAQAQASTDVIFDKAMTPPVSEITFLSSNNYERNLI